MAASDSRGGAINPDNGAAGHAAAWRTGNPKLLVVDNLLTPEALAALRRFCLGSTIWRKTFPGGYLGALPESGFAAPLLAQIAEEFPETFPEIFGDHPLRNSGPSNMTAGFRGINIMPTSRR